MQRKRMPLCAIGLVFALLVWLPAHSQDGRAVEPPNAKAIPPGAKIYIAPMEGGFENYLAGGIVKKGVPVVIVTDRSKADFEISGVSQSDKAGWAKILFMGTDASREQASIKIVNIATGEVVFGYNVHKGSSARGKQSAAEACAKHLKKKIESRPKGAVVGMSIAPR